MKCKFVDPEEVHHSLNSVLTCATRVEIFESLSKKSGAIRKQETKELRAAWKIININKK